jgi:hypothetical protein
MGDFKRRFAEYNAATGEYAFSNVRNGLIVGLVRIYPVSQTVHPANTCSSSPSVL